MALRFKWTTYALFICGLGYIGIYQVPNVINFYKQKNTSRYASCIIESSSMHDILDYVHDQQTIAIFDIDNTLIHPNKDLGSSQWFGYILKQKTALGMSIQDALVESLPIYYEIQEHITQYPVEQKTPAILSTLQKKGIVTLALTARSLPMVKRTHEQLQTAGFYFGHTKEFDQEFTIPAEQPALLSHGIIFCGNNNKGQILLKTLGMCGYKPKTVIFVDDQLTYVLEVEKECLLNKIHFVGIRYSKLDPLIAQFDPARAEKQYKELLGKDYSEHRTPAQQKADISARPTLLTAIILPD